MQDAFYSCFQWYARSPRLSTSVQFCQPDSIGATMKNSYLYILSLALLITGFVCVWLAWHGDANFTTGIPVGVSSIQFCGSASGGRTLAGFLSGLLGIILSAVALGRTSV